MIRVGLIFELKCGCTRPGDTVRVAGAKLELGNWQCQTPGGTLQLRTNTLMYPRWGTAWPIWIEVPQEQASSPINLEYKYVIESQSNLRLPSKSIWEDDINNRCAVLMPEDGTAWLIVDERWNVPGEPSVSRLDPVDASRLWCKFETNRRNCNLNRFSLDVRSCCDSCVKSQSAFLLTPTAGKSRADSLADEPLEEDGEFAIVREFQDWTTDRFSTSKVRSFYSPRKCSSPETGSTMDPWEIISALKTENAALKDLVKSLMASLGEDASPDRKVKSSCSVSSPATTGRTHLPFTPPTSARSGGFSARQFKANFYIGEESPLCQWQSQPQEDESPLCQLQSEPQEEPQIDDCLH